MDNLDPFTGVAVFVTAARSGTFTKAGEKLGLTKSAVGKAIARLEERLGFKLFHRTTRLTRLTADGEAYYQRCLVILNDVDDLEAEFSHAGHNPQGRIRIDLSGSLCRLVLLPALPRFCAAYPQIHLDITVSDRHIDLIREGVDCVLRFGGLEIDRDARTVTVNDQPAELTSYQFDLLVAMAERAGRVLTRDQIMEAVRGRELEAFDRSIDVHIGRIRTAIEVDSKDPKRILTVRGVGYVFAKQQE